VVAPFVHPEPLGDGVVVLRAWQDGDTGAVEQASQDARIPTGTTVPAVYTPEEGLAFVHRQRGRYTSGEGISFAVAGVLHDVAVGLVVLMRRPQQGVLGIGYWVVPQARGRGLARRAVGLATRWALDDAGAARVEGWVDPANLPSQRTLLRNGYLREGLLRSFMEFDGVRSDLVVYSRLPTDPAPV